MHQEDPPEPGTRAAQREATAAAILDAARDVFEQVGFDAANVRTIAARAGVSAGSVLHHYGDKRALLHAALWADLDATISAAVAPTPDAPAALDARLQALTRAMFAYYKARPGLSRALLRESLFADAPWAARFTGQTARVHAAITAWAMRARPALREGVDPALLAVSYLSFFYFGLIAWTQGAHEAPESLIDHLVQQHLSGLLVPPPEGSADGL